MSILERKTWVNQKTIEYIHQLREKEIREFNQDEIDQIILYLVSDLSDMSSNLARSYLDEIIRSIPPEFNPIFFAALDQIEEETAIQKIILYLIRSKKPLYCMIGLKLIQKIKNSSYTSLIEPFIYSNHLPLRQLTIRILLDNPGNIETILEQNLSDRNPKRRGLTEKLLFRINPTNLKIAQKRLTSVDFLERIQAISILADTKDKKIIVKLAPILKDPDISVRKAAIEGMVGIGGKKAKMILRDHMLVETHLPLRKFILSSFNTI